jgi:hypothetical protein
MSQPDFTVDVYQNEFLPEGGRDVNAIVTVTSTGTAATGTAASGTAEGSGAGSAEIIIVDCSGSMGTPQTKIAAARTATAAAVDVIRDGVAFAVIAGTKDARPVFPADGGMAVADARTRQLAKQAAARLRPGGQTAIGQWLRLAHRYFGTVPAGLRHAILLTDGKNDPYTARDLDEAISLCEGVFSCDCRGIGTDWEVRELRKISTALLGTVDIVPDPAGLAADFTAMMETAMGKQVADVGLRVWNPQHATIRVVKQVAPTVEDLTGRGVQASPQLADYPTGAWGAGESRDYHLCVTVTPAAVGREMLAARVSLVIGTPSGPQVLGQGLVKAIWTDDEEQTTRINPQVASYTGQAELAEVIQEGLAARAEGDEDSATAKFGRAVELAKNADNDDIATLLEGVVEVDTATGTVRLKRKVEAAVEMALDTRSTKTVRTRK